MDRFDVSIAVPRVVTLLVAISGRLIVGIGLR